MALAAAAAVVFAAALLGWAQYAPSGGGPLGNLPGTRPGSDMDPTIEMNPIWGEKRLRAMNVERHKSVVSDTDKLLKLARQLDAEIASNSTDELTDQELHKVAEIEKLAHNVKAKMAQSFGDSPGFRPAPIPVGGSGRP
ncbi:MAG TPA: hypothetical protein VK574_06130 [Terracidiphilus sp.]|nr:hypothetical protein [Terracidiphilus sp.]